MERLQNDRVTIANQLKNDCKGIAKQLQGDFKANVHTKNSRKAAE
jgi:hypothetical protein